MMKDSAFATKGAARFGALAAPAVGAETEVTAVVVVAEAVTTAIVVSDTVTGTADCPASASVTGGLAFDVGAPVARR